MIGLNSFQFLVDKTCVSHEDNHFKKLPAELFRHILSYLDKQNLKSTTLVNTQWKQLTIAVSKQKEGAQLKPFMDFLTHHLKEKKDLQKNLDFSDCRSLFDIHVKLKEWKTAILNHFSFLNHFKNLLKEELNELENLLMTNVNMSLHPAFGLISLHKNYKGKELDKRISDYLIHLLSNKDKGPSLEFKDEDVYLAFHLASLIEDNHIYSKTVVHFYRKWVSFFVKGPCSSLNINHYLTKIDRLLMITSQYIHDDNMPLITAHLSLKLLSEYNLFKSLQSEDVNSLLINKAIDLAIKIDHIQVLTVENVKFCQFVHETTLFMIVEELIKRKDFQHAEKAARGISCNSTRNKALKKLFENLGDKGTVEQDLKISDIENDGNLSFLDGLNKSNQWLLNLILELVIK
jgi:hypothetical protein